jgi:capsular polysaccharide biosynthesis protein
MRKIASKFIDPGYTARNLLVRKQPFRKVPMLGTVMFDSVSRFRRVRDFMPIETVGSDIYSWHIPNGILSNGFIVYDEDHVYVDSSIHVHLKQDINAVSDHFLSVISESPAPVDIYADKSVLVVHNEGGGTWGHFLVQNFPKILLYLRHYVNGYVAMPRGHTLRQSNNFAGLLDVYGVPQHRILPIDGDKSYRFKEIVLIDFMWDASAHMPHKIALDLLETVPTSRVQKEAVRPAIFIDRLPGTSNRSIANASELTPILCHHGLERCTLGRSEVKNQIDVWRNSRLIVSVLGSDLANLVFASKACKVLSLSPDWFGDTFFYNLAVCKDIQWNELRCGTIVDEGNPIHRSSFSVDPDILDTMLATLAH